MTRWQHIGAGGRATTEDDAAVLSEYWATAFGPGATSVNKQTNMSAVEGTARAKNGPMQQWVAQHTAQGDKTRHES
jgi:hypothetical protein